MTTKLYTYYKNCVPSSNCHQPVVTVMWVWCAAIFVKVLLSYMDLYLKWAQEHCGWPMNQWKCVLFSDETNLQLQDDCQKYFRVVYGFLYCLCQFWFYWCFSSFCFNVYVFLFTYMYFCLFWFWFVWVILCFFVLMYVFFVCFAFF